MDYYLNLSLTKSIGLSNFLKNLFSPDFYLQNFRSLKEKVKETLFFKKEEIKEARKLLKEILGEIDVLDVKGLDLEDEIIRRAIEKIYGIKFGKDESENLEKFLEAYNKNPRKFDVFGRILDNYLVDLEGRKVEHDFKKNSSSKRKLFYALLGIAIPAVIGGLYYKFVYEPEEKRRRIEEDFKKKSGMDDYEFSKFMWKFKDNVNLTDTNWIEFARNWKEWNYLTKNIYQLRNENITEVNEILRSYNKTFLNLLFEQIDGDKRIKLNETQLLNLKNRTLNYLEWSDIKSANKIESIYYLGNLTSYFSMKDRDIKNFYSAGDIKKVVELIEKDPMIFKGLSGNFTLVGVGTDILSELVKRNYTASSIYPYLTWSISKKGEMVVDLINTRRSTPVIGYVKRPDREIDFNIRDDYGTNHTFIELLEKRREQIIRNYLEGMFKIGIKPEEILEKMNNTKINADIAMLHISLPFSIFSADDLKGNWPDEIYPEDYLADNLEKIILINFANNSKAYEIYKKIIRDYEDGVLEDPYFESLDKRIDKFISSCKRQNKELGRDLNALFENGSEIARYGIITMVLGCSDRILEQYGLPGRTGHEEFRVHLSLNIGGAIGVPVYGFTAEKGAVDHGDVAIVLLPKDYELLMKIDSSPLVYDPLTQAMPGASITRKNANYYTSITGKVLEPYVLGVDLIGVPILGDPYMPCVRTIFKYEG